MYETNVDSDMFIFYGLLHEKMNLTIVLVYVAVVAAMNEICKLIKND